MRGPLEPNAAWRRAAEMKRNANLIPANQGVTLKVRRQRMQSRLGKAKPPRQSKAASAKQSQVCFIAKCQRTRSNYRNTTSCNKVLSVAPSPAGNKLHDY